MGTKCLADILSEREKIANWMEVGMIIILIIMMIIKSQDNDHDDNQDDFHDHHHDNDVNLGMLGISLIAAKGRA